MRPLEYYPLSSHKRSSSYTLNILLISASQFYHTHIPLSSVSVCEVMINSNNSVYKKKRKSRFVCVKESSDFQQTFQISLTNIEIFSLLSIKIFNTHYPWLPRCLAKKCKNSSEKCAEVTDPVPVLTKLSLSLTTLPEFFSCTIFLFWFPAKFIFCPLATNPHISTLHHYPVPCDM